MKNTMFTNRLTVMAMTMVSSLFFFTGCEKENENTTLPEGAMKISAEASQINDGIKTTVSDLNVNWVNDDKVKVNDNEYPVTISDGVPYLLNINNSVDMYACFPSTHNSISSSTATINYPASYEYETVGGVQKLDLPMVAYAVHGSTELLFKHANSTIEVRVKNKFGVTYMLDSITIISNSEDKALSGTGTVNTQTAQTIHAPDPTDANKKVVMTFGSGLSINNDDIKKVQIPVFPAGSTSITVRIAGRPANIALNNGKVDAAVRFVYVNSATVNLDRAKVLAAPCTMKIDNLAMKKLYPTFSVSSTLKVHFSKGNLQYIASSDEWQFAGSQTETIGTANNNISSTNNSPIDLFGWGTGSNPTNTSTNNADYDTFNDWGSRTLYGSSQWRTLAYTEWQYLLGSRGGNMYVKAAIAGKEGVIIFPDNYTPSYSFVSINVRTIEYTDNNISIETWRDLEADGCIFLPTTGMRDGITGSSWSNAAYWSATPNGGDKALRVLAGRGLFYYGNSSNEDNKFRGMAVRLVQNVD